MKSVLIIGLGRFGRHMARTMVNLKNEVLAIDNDETRANESLEYIGNIQIGDATSEKFIASLGVRNFDMCVVAIGDNFQSSLETTALLKEYGAKFILARANRDVHKKFLLHNGADEVVYAERAMAERMAMKYGSAHVFDYIKLADDYSIYEISVPSSWVGKSILAKGIRSRYKISILATKTNGKINPLPQPEHVFTSDENLIVMGHKEDIQAITR
ncbi:MAG: TrkA family potassium uptake protein [Oscillospiraceae bacterium]